MIKSIKHTWSQKDRPFGKAETLNKGPRDLVHYSRTSGLKQLDPAHMGTSGIGGLQYKHGVPENKSTFYYTQGSNPESMVTQGARSKYVVRPTPQHRIYDLGLDPEHLMPEVRRRNQGAFNEDMLHGIIKERGYHGVRWKMHDDTHVVQMYHPMDVQAEEHLGKSLVSRYDSDMGDMLTKGFVRNAAMATALAMAPGAVAADRVAAPQSQVRTQPSFGQRMLRTIASVESSGGTNISHKQVNRGINAGARAYGKYGLMPITIRETIGRDPQLRAHGALSRMGDEEVHAYMYSHPGLEDSVAQSHLKRLRGHFGDDPAKIGAAWLNGVTGTKRAIKEGRDIGNNWHVKKIMAAFKASNL
jgi:hypothetical protein